jgi:hypothetical protein
LTATPTPAQELARATKSLREGGWIVLALYAAPADPVAQAILELRTVRAGGTPRRTTTLSPFSNAPGLSNVHAVPRIWAAPIRFVMGRRPS